MILVYKTRRLLLYVYVSVDVTVQERSGYVQRLNSVPFVGSYIESISLRLGAAITGL